jgi:transcriptional regulator with XRE-family HTH domain
LVDQLRTAIRESGQTLTALAGASGVGKDRLSRFMRGQRDLTLAAAEKLCRALHLHLAPDAPAVQPPAALPEKPQKGRRKPGKKESDL